MAGCAAGVRMGIHKFIELCVTRHGHSAGAEGLLGMAVQTTGILLGELPLMRILMTAAAVFRAALILRTAGVGIAIRIGEVCTVACRAGHRFMRVCQDEACETVHGKVHAALSQRPGVILRLVAECAILAEIRPVGGVMAVHAHRSSYALE